MKRNRNVDSASDPDIVYDEETKTVALAMLDGSLPLVMSCGGGYGSPTALSFTTSQQISPGPTQCLITFNPLGAVDGATMFSLGPNSGTVFVATSVDLWNVNLVWGSSVFIPLADTGLNILTSPPLFDRLTNAPINAEIGRVTGFQLSIESSQTSTTTSALTGSITGGWMSDFSDVRGVSLSAPRIAQATPRTKDAVLRVRLQDGLMTIAGPDFFQQYHQVQSSSCVAFPGSQYIVSPLPVAYPYNTSGIASSTTASSSGTTYVLITPGDSKDVSNATYIAWAAAAPNSVMVVVNPTSPFAPPRLRLFAKYYAGNSLLAAASVNIVHYYASMTVNTGTPPPAFSPSVIRYYDTFSVQDNAIVQLSFPDTMNSVTPVTVSPTTVHTTEPPFIKGAVWVGCVVTLSVNGLASGSTAVLQLLQVEQLECHNEYTDGPTRIALIEQMVSAQPLVVRGSIAAEVSTTAALAPYTNNTKFVEVSTLSLERLRRAFNNPSNLSLRRVYTGAEYRSQLAMLRSQRTSDGTDQVGGSITTR